MALLAILVGASLLSTFSIPLAGRLVRPEHLAAPLMVVAVIMLRRGRGETPLRVDTVAALAAGWVVVNGISSWLFAPQPMESFVHVLRMGLLVGIFLTVASLPLEGARHWAAAFRLWLGLGVLELAYGLVIWFCALFWDVWLLGASLEPDLAGISIRGTQYERNLFGILAATLLLVTTFTLVAQRVHRRPLLASNSFLALGAVVASAALVLSLTRSAWLAAVAAAPVTLVLLGPLSRQQRDRSLLYVSGGLPIVLGVAIGLLQLLPPTTTTRAEEVAPGTHDAWRFDEEEPRAAEIAPGSDVGERLSSLGGLEEDTTLSTRVQDAIWALEDWRSSPILGHGTGSFGQLHGIRAGTQAWISNLVLHTLVDTGLVGLAIQMSLFFLVILGAWRAAHTTDRPELAIGLTALTLGCVAMLIAYQLTDGTWLAVFWIHLGLMANGIACASAQPRPASA